jgi:hypothetical protein
MSVPKKSLVGSRPTEKKEAAKPVKSTSIGDSKALTASALRRQALKGVPIKHMKASPIRKRG